MIRTARTLLASALALAMAACGGDAPTQQGTGGQQQEQTPAEQALITGDGSDLCLQTADLPPGYLPLTGSDNTSNARDNVFSDPATPTTPQLTASWSARPEGGASLDDRTASCSIYVFDSADIDEMYAWYTDTYPTRSQPAPVEETVPAGGPGEDPHVFHFEPNEFSGRESYTYVFRHANVIVNVDADAAAGEVGVEDVVPLAEGVQARLETA